MFFRCVFYNFFNNYIFAKKILLILLIFLLLLGIFFTIDFFKQILSTVCALSWDNLKTYLNQQTKFIQTICKTHVKLNFHQAFLAPRKKKPLIFGCTFFDPNKHTPSKNVDPNQLIKRLNESFDSTHTCSLLFPPKITKIHFFTDITGSAVSHLMWEPACVHGACIELTNLERFRFEICVFGQISIGFRTA